MQSGQGKRSPANDGGLQNARVINRAGFGEMAYRQLRSRQRVIEMIGENRRPGAFAQFIDEMDLKIPDQDRNHADFPGDIQVFIQQSRMAVVVFV